MVLFSWPWRDTRTRHTNISVKLGFCHPFCPCKAPDSVQESAQEDLDRGEVDRGQGGRTWQAFGGGKNGHETFQARIYNFREKYVIFARNLKFSKLTQ